MLTLFCTNLYEQLLMISLFGRVMSNPVPNLFLPLVYCVEGL
jgi:hypothetical protein